MEPLVSVLVLNYRNPQITVQCVKNLMKQTIFTPSPWPSPQGGGKARMEILVIDNHSRDDSIGVLRNRLGEKNIRIIETPKNLGFGGGYNYGARYAAGRYLLINNPAKILNADVVERMVQRMTADPTIGILAPKILHADSTRRSSMRSFPTPLDIIAKRTMLKKFLKKRIDRYLRLDADPDKEHDTDWVIGGCFMIPCEHFYRLRGFDERFFLFFEDIDLCRRMHQIGQRVLYDPSMSARDKRERLSGEGFWDLILHSSGRTHIASAIKYFRKWGTAP